MPRCSAYSFLHDGQRSLNLLGISILVGKRVHHRPEDEQRRPYSEDGFENYALGCLRTANQHKADGEMGFKAVHIQIMLRISLRISLQVWRFPRNTNADL